MDIEIAIDRIGAWQLPSGLYRYTSEETGYNYDVKRSDLEDLVGLMTCDDPEIRRDAYSHWCASGQQVPSVWEALEDAWGDWLTNIYLNNCDMLESLEDSSIEEIEDAIERTLKITQKLDIREAFEDMLRTRPAETIKAIVELMKSERDPIYAIDADEGDFLVANS